MIKTKRYFNKSIYEFQSQYFDFRVKGLRELWSLKEGVNKSGSPKRFSSLMSVIEGKTLNIDGWSVTKVKNDKEERPTYRYTIVHKEKGIYVYTNNFNRFVGWLNGFTNNGVGKRVTCFRNTKNNPLANTKDGWYYLDHLCMKPNKTH